MNIELRPLRDFEEDAFVRENQIAFDKAAVEEFGPQKESVIPREHIVSSIHAENAEAFRIIVDGEPVGGVVVAIHPDTQVNSLHLLFVSPDHHSRGIGQIVWRMIEEKYPETKVWETHTPYFEKRNIHFYINRCGFQIVEFFNEHHRDPRDQEGECFEMFRFEKRMKGKP